MHFTNAKGILTASSGGRGMNVYRGCTHGCIYCDSRSRCYQFKHAFEDVEVKQNAPELLEKALRSLRKPCMIATGAMSDPYLPAEERLGLTRRCLELIEQYGFGAAVLTKSDLILRDIDLLAAIHRKAKAVAQITLTVMDEALSRRLEPNVCATRRRIEVLEAFAARGVPTLVWLGPILPFITDTEENVRGILEACVRARVKGIVCFGMGLTLREGSREYYYAALDRLYPGLRNRYVQAYGGRYELESPHSARLMELLRAVCRENGLLWRPEDCFAYLNEFPQGCEQLSLFAGAGEA